MFIGQWVSSCRFSLAIFRAAVEHWPTKRENGEGDPEIPRILAVLKRNPELVSAVRRTLETGEDLAQTAAVLADLPKAQRQAVLQMIRSMQPEMG